MCASLFLLSIIKILPYRLEGANCFKMPFNHWLKPHSMMFLLGDITEVTYVSEISIDHVSEISIDLTTVLTRSI